MNNISKKIAKLLLEINAITLSPKEPYRYTSGILSPIYCDNRLTISYPEKREIIRDAFIQKIKKHNIEFDVICGTATAGIPHASFLAQKLKKPMVYVRSKSKEHGKENLVEGKLEKAKKVLVIEDHISTGGSSISAVKGVRDQGGIVEYCLAITTYEMKKAEQRFQDTECELITITDFSTIIEIAAENNYIKKDEKDMILDWNKNPEKWGKKHGFE
jgi:orotate phosphoribosyltransferase